MNSSNQNNDLDQEWFRINIKESSNQNNDLDQEWSNIEYSEKQNNDLIIFLRNIADSIEQKTIDKYHLQSIGEFFMSYQFQNTHIKDNFSQKELFKFIVMGWYIYNVIEP